MWKKSGVTQTVKFKILVILELLLLCNGIFGLLQGEKCLYSMDTMEIQMAGGEILEDGGYSVSGSSSVYGDWLWAIGYSLTPGVYRLECSYETEEEGAATIGIQALGDSFRALLSNSVTLSSGIGTQSCQFYVTGNLRKNQGFLITVSYFGSQSLTITGLEMIKTTAGSRILLFLVLVGSLLINSLVMLYEYTKKNCLEREWLLTWFGIPALAIMVSIPLMVDYIIGGEGLGLRLLRIETLAESMSQGAFWNGIKFWWLEGLDFSAPAFYFDIFLWIPALLRLIGFTMNFSYGAYVFVLNLITAAVAYRIFGRVFRSKYVGVVGSLLCTLSAYRLDSIYGGLAEEGAETVTIGSGVVRSLLAASAWPGIVLTACIAIVMCVVTKWILKKQSRTVSIIFLSILCGLCILYSMYQMSNILYTSGDILRVYTAEALVDLLQ